MPEFKLPMTKALATHSRSRVKPKSQAKAQVNVAQKVKRMLIDKYDVEAGEVRVRDLLPSDIYDGSTSISSEWGNDDWEVDLTGATAGSYSTVTDYDTFDDVKKVVSITRAAIVSADPCVSKVKLTSKRRSRASSATYRSTGLRKKPVFTFHATPSLREGPVKDRVHPADTGTAVIAFGGYTAEPESETL